MRSCQLKEGDEDQRLREDGSSKKKKKKKKVDCEWHVQESWCSITYSDTIVAHA